MSRSLRILGFCVVASVVMAACVSQPPLFEPQPVPGDRFAPKVDQFVVILDRSMSMFHDYRSFSKQELGSELAASLNGSVPELGYRAGLRAFGTGPCMSGSGGTYSALELEDYSTTAFASALDGLDCVGGRSRLGRALEATGQDLAGAKGQSAVLVISDGLHMGDEVVEAASQLHAEYGDSLCIYALVLGDNDKGRKRLVRMAEASGCGFAVRAQDLGTGAEMAALVSEVFLEPDSDGDGVGDSKDRCPNTPRGMVVDEHGCPPDSDGDGVPDYMDECPNTPPGVAVDARGCPRDSDGDGVPDYRDECPNTPAGVLVDDRGCPLDSDGDGVPDYLDECPGTLPGTVVDEKGCPKLWKFKGDVLFAFDRYEIKADAMPVLDRVAAFLVDHPGVAVEISGHTDNIGPKAYNQGLSERRAKAAKAYLVSKGVNGDRLSTAGFGLTKPVVPNDTPENRAQNRRVEFKVLD